MRILLDESVPVQLVGILIEHDCHTVKELGWAAVKNGELLRRAAERFDVLITADQNIQYEQNLDKHKVGLVVLSTNNKRRLLAAAEIVRDAVLKGSKTVRAIAHT